MATPRATPVSFRGSGPRPDPQRVAQSRGPRAAPAPFPPPLGRDHGVLQVASLGPLLPPRRRTAEGLTCLARQVSPALRQQVEAWGRVIEAAEAEIARKTAENAWLRRQLQQAEWEALEKAKEAASFEARLAELGDATRARERIEAELISRGAFPGTPGPVLAEFEPPKPDDWRGKFERAQQELEIKTQYLEDKEAFWGSQMHQLETEFESQEVELRQVKAQLAEISSIQGEADVASYDRQAAALKERTALRAEMKKLEAERDALRQKSSAMSEEIVAGGQLKAEAEEDATVFRAGLAPLLEAAGLQPEGESAASMVTLVGVVIGELRAELKLAQKKLAEAETERRIGEGVGGVAMAAQASAMKQTALLNELQSVSSQAEELIESLSSPIAKRKRDILPIPDLSPVRPDDAPEMEAEVKVEVKPEVKADLAAKMEGAREPATAAAGSGAERAPERPTPAPVAPADPPAAEGPAGGAEDPDAAAAASEPAAAAAPEEGEEAAEAPVPGISEFRIYGEVKLGDSITACGIPVNGTQLCQFQWQRATVVGQDYIDIKGAVLPEYRLSADDIDTQLRVQCTPLSGDGRAGETVTAGVNNGNLVTIDARAEQIIQEFVKAGSAVFEVALKDDTTPGLSTMAMDKKAISLSQKKLNILKEDLKTSQPKFIIESTDHTSFVLEAMGKDTAVQLADSQLRDIAVLVARIFTQQSLTTKKRGTLFPRRKKADSVVINLQ